MIYIPNPYFDFEKTNGSIMGSVTKETLLVGEPSFLFLREVGMVGHLKWRVNVEEVISKFDRARSSYWEGRYYKAPDTTYCFLREDGAEFAARFIRGRAAWDVLGYWASTEESSLIEFKDWLEDQCPQI